MGSVRSAAAFGGIGQGIGQGLQGLAAMILKERERQREEQQAQMLMKLLPAILGYQEGGGGAGEPGGASNAIPGGIQGLNPPVSTPNAPIFSGEGQSVPGPLQLPQFSTPGAPIPSGVSQAPGQGTTSLAGATGKAKKGLSPELAALIGALGGMKPKNMEGAAAMISLLQAATKTRREEEKETQDERRDREKQERLFEQQTKLESARFGHERDIEGLKVERERGETASTAAGIFGALGEPVPSGLDPFAAKAQGEARLKLKLDESQKKGVASREQIGALRTALPTVNRWRASNGLPVYTPDEWERLSQFPELAIEDYRSATDVNTVLFGRREDAKAHDWQMRFLLKRATMAAEEKNEEKRVGMQAAVRVLTDTLTARGISGRPVEFTPEDLAKNLATVEFQMYGDPSMPEFKGITAKGRGEALRMFDEFVKGAPSPKTEAKEVPLVNLPIPASIARHGVTQQTWAETVTGYLSAGKSLFDMLADVKDPWGLTDEDMIEILLAPTAEAPR